MTVQYIVRVYTTCDFEGNFEFFQSIEEAKVYANSYRNKGFLVRLIKRTYEILE